MAILAGPHHRFEMGNPKPFTMEILAAKVRQLLADE